MHTAHGLPLPLTLSNLVIQPSGPSLSVQVPHGQCVALLGIGPNLQDFTPLARTLAGHTPAQSGQVFVNGQNVTTVPIGQRKLGLLSPHSPLFSHLSVTQNILFPLKAEGGLSQAAMTYRTAEILALMGLDAVRNATPATLNAEQTFRAQLARLLVVRPSAVVLETPFTGMDHSSTMRLITLLEKLQRAIGLSTLLLTHNRTEALLLGEQLGIMQNGALLQLGSPATLLQRPTSEAVATAFGEANALTGKVLYLEDDCAELRLPSGEVVEAMAAAGLEENDLATICIAPDRLSVMFPRTAPTESAEPGMLVCSLVSARHIGTSIHLRFRLHDGTEILAHRPPVHLPKELEPGRLALVAWQAGSATAFPMDQKSG
ncbi:ABC transporter ATP-binding protein [Acetobacter orientalis]|uniref:Spermidine/putrescine ABC transporter ATP-binding protein n=1 Tax=Acetobacter orientalis TaxID=146474 RepID=A0A252A308_9PROT|nr:ABC transporter ATP-binding protein [Acetobacter orientalis]OUI82914.1 spermidine/putrescine ABC transporter ATP-binding protein [Acetobacter orientalis]